MVSSNLKYVGKLWSYNAGYSSLLTNQDNIDEIKRVDWTLDAQRFLFTDYYGVLQVSFLSNTEQETMGCPYTVSYSSKQNVGTMKCFISCIYGVNKVFSWQLIPRSLDLLFAVLYVLYFFLIGHNG